MTKSYQEAYYHATVKTGCKFCSTFVENYWSTIQYSLNGNCNCGGLQAVILLDISNNAAKMEMQVLGVISGPWMKMFYTSADKQINHLDHIVVIRNVVILLKESCKIPLQY